MAFKNKAQNLCTERFLKPSPAVHHVKVYFDDFLFQWREIYVHLTFLALHTLQFAERNTGSYNRPTGLDSATALMLYRGIQKTSFTETKELTKITIAEMKHPVFHSVAFTALS